MASMADESLILRCDCASEVVGFDYWAWDDNPDDFFVEIYEAVPSLGWRRRLGMIWNVLRGREYVMRAAVFSPDDVARLHDFCERCLLRNLGA